MTVLKHAIETLEAVESRLEEISPHAALEAAQREVGELIDRESALPPRCAASAAASRVELIVIRRDKEIRAKMPPVTPALFLLHE